MTFFPELEESRAEVRKDVAGLIVFWAHADAAGIVSASTVAGDCRFEVFDHAGNSIQGLQNVTPAADTNGLTSVLALPIPAISTLQEDAYAVVYWKRDGETVEHVETIYFDVCLQLWGMSSVSINDLAQIRPDIGLVLDQQAARIGGGQTRESLASIFGARAHGELYHWIRAQVSAEASGRIDTLESVTRPRLILDRRALARVEALIACSLVYEGDMTSTETAESDAAALYQHFNDRARSAFKSLGNLRYDASEDRVVDTIKPSFGRTVRLRRVQA